MSKIENMLNILESRAIRVGEVRALYEEGFAFYDLYVSARRQYDEDRAKVLDQLKKELGPDHELLKEGGDK